MTPASPPRRIRLSRARGWRLPENAVNVARPGPWGNPFVVGKKRAGRLLDGREWNEMARAA